MRQKREKKSGYAGKTVFAVIFFAVLVLINYLVYKNQAMEEIPDWKPLAALFAGDILLIALFLVLKSRKLAPLTESGAAQMVVSCLLPAAACFLAEGIMGSLKTIAVSAVFLNIALYYCLFLLLFVISGRIQFAAKLLCIVSVAAALAEYYVMKFRGQPITLFDLQNIGTALTVANSYSFEMSVNTGLLLQCALGYLTLLYGLKKVNIPWRKIWILVRAGGAAGSVLGLFLLARTAGEGTFNFWKISENFQKKGFAYTLLWEVKYLNIEKPEGYSEANVKKVAEEISQDTEQQEADTVTQPENLIVIMNESMADFTHVSELETEDVIMPYISGMSGNTIKGYLQVPVFGGGTADTEYEFLTGNTKQFLPAGSTAYMVYCSDPEYGMARILKDQGYETFALHPYYASNWNRSTVYTEMGFDEFYSSGNWGSELEKIRLYASDASAYDKVIELTEEKEGKVFTFLVTLQNHGSYTEDALYGYEPTVELEYDADYPMAEIYLSLLNESDQAFQNLISYYENCEETTMIVMFGDHFPNVETEFYAEILGKSIDSLSSEETQLIYQTPYIIWTNYGLDAGTGETMSANYFGSYILQLAGLDMPVYNQFLLQLKDSIPVIGQGMLYGADNCWYALDDLPENYQEQILQYQMLQYYRVSDRGSLSEDLFDLR